jgi:hypothetical protein
MSDVAAYHVFVCALFPVQGGMWTLCNFVYAATYRYVDLRILVASGRTIRAPRIRYAMYYRNM